MKVSHQQYLEAKADNLEVWASDRKAQIMSLPDLPDHPSVVTIRKEDYKSLKQLLNELEKFWGIE